MCRMHGMFFTVRLLVRKLYCISKSVKDMQTMLITVLMWENNIPRKNAK